MVLSALIDDLAEQYEKDNTKIHKSQIRDITRMLMYVGSFRDKRNRFITSYSVPVASINLSKAYHWTNCLCMVNILKYDELLTKPAEASRILFGTSKNKSELSKLIDSLASSNIIKETKSGNETVFKVLTDRYFTFWK